MFREPAWKYVDLEPRWSGSSPIQANFNKIRQFQDGRKKLQATKLAAVRQGEMH